MNHIFVSEMAPGQRVIGVYVVTAVHPHITLPDGNEYWKLELSDRTGDILAYVRECPAVELSEDDVGRAIFIDSKVCASETKERFLMCSYESIELRDFEYLSEEEIMNYYIVAPIDPQKAMVEVEAFVASIDDEDYRGLCQNILLKNRSDFLACPATEAEHHSFVCGLLMHTNSMLHLAEYVSALYGEALIDRSLLLAGTLLHDIGRLSEYSLNSIGCGVWNDYGVLEMHETLGAIEIDRAAEECHIDREKTEILKNMVLAHHYTGKEEASIRPASLEAAILGLLNNLDCLIEGFREIVEAK